MNRGKFAVLSVIAMFFKDANSYYEVSEKKSGIESLVVDLIEVTDLDVNVSSGGPGWNDSREIEGVSSATKTRALKDLVDLGVFSKEFGKYKLADEFKPESAIGELGDQDES